MQLDITRCPPVPPEHYRTVAELFGTGQLPLHRMIALLHEDDAFRAWWREQKAKTKTADAEETQ